MLKQGLAVGRIELSHHQPKPNLEPLGICRRHDMTAGKAPSFGRVLIARRTMMVTEVLTATTLQPSCGGAGIVIRVGGRVMRRFAAG